MVFSNLLSRLTVTADYIEIINIVATFCIYLYYAWHSVLLVPIYCHAALLTLPIHVASRTLWQLSACGLYSNFTFFIIIMLAMHVQSPKIITQPVSSYNHVQQHNAY